MRGRVVLCACAVALAVVPIAQLGSGSASAASAGRPSASTPRVVRANAQVSAPRAVQNVPVRSRFETSARAESRDVGISVALPDGHDLWLFGDTAVFRRSVAGRWQETGFIGGSTALEARYRRGVVPHGGDYPSGVPAQFVPAPTNVYLPGSGGRRCTATSTTYPARWPTGAAVLPSNRSQVLVTYVDVCVTRSPVDGTPRQRVEGWGYMLYDWPHHRVARGPVDVFTPLRDAAALSDARAFGSPVFVDGKLTLFASHCVSLRIGCEGGQVWSATLPATPAAMGRRSSYRVTRLATDRSGSWNPAAISVGRYGATFRLVETTSVGGTYAIFTAPNVGAQWHLDASGRLPGCRKPSRGFCYALAGHPELSTPSRVFVSYLQPDYRPRGHIVVSSVPS